jgi:hypothetical protein
MTESNEKMKREELLEAAVEGIDTRFIKAAEDPETAFAAAGNRKPRKPLWLRCAAAAAVCLVLMTVAGLSVFIANRIARGAWGSQDSGGWYIDLEDYQCRVATYRGEMTEEDKETVLGIWEKYEHKEGHFANIPDVFFRIVEDYEDQRFEFFSYDTYDGLIQYAKNGNYDDTEKRGLYAFLSAEDRLTVLEIVEKYRKELVRWTLNTGGSDYVLSEGSVSAFSDCWREADRGYGCEKVTLEPDSVLDKRRRVSKKLGSDVQKAIEVAELVRDREPVFTLTLHNTVYGTDRFRYFADVRVLEYTYSGKTDQVSGKTEIFRDYVLADDRFESALLSIIDVCTGAAEAPTYKVIKDSGSRTSGVFDDGPTNVIFMGSDKTSILDHPDSDYPAAVLMKRFGGVYKVCQASLMKSAKSPFPGSFYFLQYAEDGVPVTSFTNRVAVYFSDADRVLMDGFVNPFIEQTSYYSHCEWILSGEETVYLLQSVTYLDVYDETVRESDGARAPTLKEYHYVFLVTCRYSDSEPYSSPNYSDPGHLEFLMVSEGEGRWPPFLRE